MNTVNAILTDITDALTAPLAAWPLVNLLLWSAVSGVVMAVVFRYTSNQRALKRVADRSRAHVLAIKLFKDDLGSTYRSLGSLLYYTAARIGWSLPPMLVMVVPFVLLLSQLALRYEHEPLGPNEAAVVELQLTEESWQEDKDVTVEVSETLAVETEPLRDTQERAIYWRVRAREVGPSTVRWPLATGTVEKQIALSDGPERLCAVETRRPGAGFWDRLLHPGERAFASGSPVRAIVVHHPRRSVPVFGLDVPWWLTFLIVSMLAAVAVRPIVKVRF